MAGFSTKQLERLKARGQQGAVNAQNSIEQYADAELVRLPLEQISDRPAGDTRPLNTAQVTALAESIAAIGLIAPLAVDSRHRLLAGGHRRAALQQLQERDLPKFNDLFPGGIPCRRFSFDSEAEPEQALTIEISENEKRRNYTRAEIQAVALRLQEQGYSRAKGRGNRQPLIPALATAFGVNYRTITRALNEESNRTAVPFNEGPSLRNLALPVTLLERIQELAKAEGITPAELVERAIERLS